MEVYGEKPKRFTREWWEYIRMYYKWHIIITIITAFVIVTTITQCATRTEYDLQLTVVTESETAFALADIMAGYAEKVIDDVTGNGINEVLVTPISLNEKIGADYLNGQMTKLTIEMAMPESYIFIMNRNVADMAIQNGLLEKTEAWAGDAESDGYVIGLKNDERLREFGLISGEEELFIGVVALFEKNKDNELEKGRFENGVKLARNLVGLE